MFKMSKKTALITGAARGIGFGIAEKLASDGFNIAIFDILDKEQDTVKENLAKLDALGAETLYFQGNLAKQADCIAFVAAAAEKFGSVDVMVNNAGVAPKVRMDMLETTAESLDFVFGINIKGTFFMAQAAANQMVKQGKGGTMVNISSMSAYATSVNRPEYCISKAGVSMITQLFAKRLAGEGINVYEVRPGVIKTDMTSVVTEKYDKLIADGVFPIKRWGFPEDIAKAVSAFVSGAFPYSTGEVINVDGGFHIQDM